MFKKNINSIWAIIDGKNINNKGKQVIGYGEIVKTEVLKKLSTKFKIHKNIILMKITKKNIDNPRKNNLVQIS